MVKIVYHRALGRKDPEGTKPEEGSEFMATLVSSKNGKKIAWTETYKRKRSARGAVDTLYGDMLPYVPEKYRPTVVEEW